MSKYEPPMIEGDDGGADPASSSVLILIAGIAIYLIIVNIDGTEPPDCEGSHGCAFGKFV